MVELISGIAGQTNLLALNATMRTEVEQFVHAMAAA